MLAITHDIKAPLGSVMGYIDLLSRLTGDKREELYLHNMKESSLLAPEQPVGRLDIKGGRPSARRSCSKRSAPDLRRRPRRRASG